ncbi:membrane protein insertase YidC [Caulobacter mirabilis]|uniref:Membrane protein insertase YidC n=1 Tax=Caulobacter mirabilis TaxID=69666 RepID=A0A2D2ASE2_9CAUL|nr:membrane protein insertase YidC [Caulobacter mirabilis]ATQ40906.1 membrane protein insertase YidC [Caulobacter mirabilis]ATQ44809.1 membrane protein insertase YidC [Caulobacter mirabilis]
MQQNDSRNTIAFFAIAVLILIGYQFFVFEPQKAQKAAESRAKAAAAQAQAPTGPMVPKVVTREVAKAASPRVAVDTPALSGSLRLQGARIDDLYLKGYRETLAKNSPPVELFRPEGAEHAWFAEFGWTGQNIPGLPGAQTVWTKTAGDVLAPGKPVTLTYAAPNGLTFTRKVSVDDKFMFTIDDAVTNAGGVPITLAPYASVQRQGLAPHHGKGQNVHEGAVGILSDGDKGRELRLSKYKDWKKKASQTFASTGGWLGVTDKYWLAALVPNQSEKINASYRVTPSQDVDIYDVNYVGAPRTIAAGATVTETTRLFAGAKVVQDLQGYEKALGIPDFDKAVDWGMLWFFTRPFFMALEYIFGLVGNFGVAILAVTLLVRLLLFPLAHKSYESMSRMKKLQKPMEELKARYKDDPAKMQQETLALYQREKVNPVAGCLPILLQIPIFLAFYKVLSVTIEMRHAPFIAYIQDLSAPDPHTILNLFGLIPWNVAATPFIGGVDALVHLGPLPLLYGFTMWLTTAMNPPAPDPMQQRIFQLMPILFTFIMAGFPAGLLLYWTFSNVFSIFQQYIIMHRLKVDNPIDDFLAKIRGEGKAIG